MICSGRGDTNIVPTWVDIVSRYWDSKPSIVYLPGNSMRLSGGITIYRGVTFDERTGECNREVQVSQRRLGKVEAGSELRITL